MIKEEDKHKSPTVNQSSGEMLIIEEDPPIYNTIKYACLLLCSLLQLILVYSIVPTYLSLMFFFVSRKKIEEEKPNLVVSPQQTRTGSTSTDVTYASQ